MPKECLKCGFLTADEAVESCDRCGNVRMRFTLLAGLKIEESPSKRMVATVNVRTRETWLDRFREAGLFALWMSVSGFVLVGAVVFSTPDEVVAKKTLGPQLLHEVAAAYPWQTALGIALLPAAAAAAAALVALRNVFLAQQVALVTAPPVALGMLGGFVALELEPPMWAWIASPVLAGAVGFVFGLRMARHVRASEVAEQKKTEYRVIDPWDRKARARFRSLSGRQGSALDKAMLGVVVWYLVSALPIYWLQMLLGFGSNGPPPDVERARFGFKLVAVVLAGVTAAAGSRAPMVQGALVGAAIALIEGVWSGTLRTQAWLLKSCLTLFLAAAGGILGGMMFQPPRVARGKKIEAADRLVYQVDAAPDLVASPSQAAAG